MATIWIAVFHLASCVTGTLTFSAARYSRRPETRISRHRMMIAAHSDQPAMRAGRVGGEQQQAGGDQQLVGDRVEHPADVGGLLPGARQIAVEIVGEAGDDEDDQRRPAREVARLQPALEEKAQHDQRHREDAGVGQHVGQVECALGHVFRDFLRTY